MKKNIINEPTYADYISGEEWRVAAGYAYYLVSNLGRVYSMYQNKILKQDEVHGYLEVKLKSASGIFKHIKVHRLVAQAFLDNPEHKRHVHHIDGNPQNNRLTNLMYVTPCEHKAIHSRMREHCKGGEANG